MVAQVRARLSSLPRTVWLIAGGALVAAVVVTAILVIFDPFGGPFVTLNAKRTAYNHPDGLVVSRAVGTRSVQVQVSTIPREEFMADAAGGVWAEARKALPASLTPLSPIYTIKVKGEGEIAADVTIPNGAQPLELLDLYNWDEQAHTWMFVPSAQDLAQQVIHFTPEAPVSHIMVVHANPGSIAAGVIVSPGGPDLGPNYGLAIPEGVTVGPRGDVEGTPVAATASTVLPVVYGSGFEGYANQSQRIQVTAPLGQAALPYDGLILDFAPAPQYTGFVKQLGDEIHSHGKRVEVVVRGTDLDSYDLAGLGRIADRVWFAPGENPTLYLPAGGIQTALARIVGSVDRAKVGLWVSALDVDVSGDSAIAVGSSQALSVFGNVEPMQGYTNLLAPGDNLAVRLSGHLNSMGYDAPLGMNYATYTDDQGQLHYVYFASPQSLSRKLEWARQFGLGSVAVYGIAHPEAIQHIADGLSGFINQQTLSDPAAIQLQWQVSGASGAKLDEQSGDLSLIQYLWQAARDPGRYVIDASVRGTGQDDPISTLVVEVGQLESGATATPQATPTATPAGSKATPIPSPGAPSAQPTPAPVSGSIAAGTFELGGQVNGSIQHESQMQQAGMKWVKYQVPFGQIDPAGAANFIAEGHAKGFKVLLSIPGPPSPTTIDYAGYVSFVAGIAAQGPEAIEIWNEMNLKYQWPLADIDGANYVNNMLAPAYKAIKATNPGVMVISGAPAPTGLYGQLACGDLGCADYLFLTQMRDAGGANYLDCVGVHYNEGIVSPSQNSGDPRGDDYYTRFYGGMQNNYYALLGKPLCFTELGYLTPEGYGTLPGAFGWAQNTTVAQQAAWLAEAAVLASQSGKVRLMIIFNVDFTQWGSDPQAGYAILRPGGSCPACDALHNVQP